MANSDQRRTTNRKIYNNWFYACKIVRRLSKNLSILKIIIILFCTNNILHFKFYCASLFSQTIIALWGMHFSCPSGKICVLIVIGKRTTSLKMLFCILSKFWKQRFIQEIFIFALESCCHKQLIIDISLNVILHKICYAIPFWFSILSNNKSTDA